ncbi:MAG: leucine-rich repeat protein [Bacteroidales bacterium]|nr:leucine-rich repeat protein [Bacteroidales bacterium]
MKRIISFFILAIAALQGAWAYDFVTDGMAFSVTDAAKKEVVLEYDPMHPYTGDFVIPATATNGNTTYSVVGTGTMCFYASTISSITFGANQTYIGENTFFGCANLTHVEIPERITSIGGSVFMYCANLEEVTLPSGITVIPEYAFNSCTNLRTLTIPDAVTDVAYASLAYCENLESVIVGSGVKSIGKQAFFNSTVKHLVMRGEVPPTVNPDAFPAEILQNTELEVPAAALERYRQAEVWRDFVHVNGNTDLDPEPVAPIFMESFEDWDGGTPDCLPEGWDEISKAEPPHETYWTNGLNLTWEIVGQRWADEPQDGQYYARIENFFYSNNGAIVNGQQDEWLISPTVHIPDNGQALYFQLGYHPGWVLCDGKTLEFTSITNVMEVHISRDGGETWQMMWDCLPAARALSRNELIEDLASTGCMWLPVRIGLHDFAGDDIRFAFCYVGKGGASMNIDDVQIRQPQPGEEYPEYSDTTVDPTTFYAHYGIPEGCFFYGDNDDLYLLPGGVIMPAHTELTFHNDSYVPADARYEWTYTDPEAYNLSYSKFSYKTTGDKNLTIKTGSFNFSTLPQLKASFTIPTAERDTTVVFARNIGETGRPAYWQVGGAPGEDYFGYDGYQRPRNNYGFSAYDQNLGSNVYFGDMAFSSYMFGTGELADEAGITGFASIFHQPAAPYQIDGGLRIAMCYDVEDAAEIRVSLRKATKVNETTWTLGDEIAHATASGAQLRAVGKTFSGSTMQWSRFLFPALYDDAGNEVKPLIDEPIAVVVEGWNEDGVNEFAVMTNATDPYTETCALWTGGALGNTARAYYEHYALAVTLNAHFPYLYTETPDVQVSANGGSASVSIDQYRYLMPFDIEGLPEWLTAENQKDATQRRYNNLLTLTAQPNMTGIDRTASVLLSVDDGSRLTLTVTQPAAEQLNYRITSAANRECAVAKSVENPSEETPGTYAGDIVIPEKVTLDDGQEYTVTSIDAHAFERCYDLHSVVMPNTITEIGDSAFWGCYRSASEGLTTIKMSDGLRRSGTSAFYGCGALKSVEINDLANWCTVTFDDARANPLPWAYHLIVGGEEPEVLRIPDGVEEVRNFAFYNILGRKRVEFPEGVKSIGWAAFSFASDITEVRFNSDLEFITYGAFLMCPSITDVYCTGTTPPGAAYFFNYEFDYDVTQTATLHVPAGTKDAYSSANLWGNFIHVTEDDEDGIRTLTPDAVEDAPVYDLQGRRVTSPVKGLYISNRAARVK